MMLCGIGKIERVPRREGIVVVGLGLASMRSCRQPAILIG